MDYALLAATALGAIGLYLLLPRERAPLARLGLLMGAMALAGFFLFLVRAAGNGLGGISQGPPVYFYLFAAIMIGGAVGVICQPKPVYAALYFVLVTLAGSGLFVLLLADFMAIVLIIIYAGAILVTYVFVIMLASQSSAENAGEGAVKAVSPLYDRQASSSLIAVFVAFVLVGGILQVLLPDAPRIVDAKWGTNGQQVDVTEKLRKLTQAGDGRLDLMVGPAALGELPPQAINPILSITYVLHGTKRDETLRPGESLAIGKIISKSRAAEAPDPLMAASLGMSTPAAAAATPATRPAPEAPSNVQVLGSSLYSHYSLSLELAGILLTIALIGAVVIARKNTALEQPLGTGKLPSE